MIIRYSIYLKFIVNSNSCPTNRLFSFILVKTGLKIKFTDLGAGDRWVLGQNNVYGLETLIVNIYAPIMNDLDFSHIFEVLTSLRLKDLGLLYIDRWQSRISKSLVGELDLSDIWRFSIPRSERILGLCDFLVSWIWLLGNITCAIDGFNISYWEGLKGWKNWKRKIGLLGLLPLNGIG